MAWTAQLTGAVTNQQNSFIDITLQLTNGATGEVQTRVLHKLSYSAEEVAVYAQSVIVELETRDAAVAQVQSIIKSGPAPIQLPRDGFATPTFDALNAARAKSSRVNDLATKVDQLNVLQAAATANIIPANDADLKAAQDAVQSLAPSQAAASPSP